MSDLRGKEAPRVRNALEFVFAAHPVLQSASAGRAPIRCLPFRCACPDMQRALAPLDPDRLRIHKRMRSEMRQLSAVTAVLDTADGNSRIR